MSIPDGPHGSEEERGTGEPPLIPPPDPGGISIFKERHSVATDQILKFGQTALGFITFQELYLEKTEPCVEKQV